MTPNTMIRFRSQPSLLPGMLLALALMVPFPLAAEERSGDPPADPAKPAPADPAKAELPKLPGVEINLEERCVDVESMICLDDGALELIACTKDSKEHEAIINLEGKAKHVHLCLLLLGAKPGNPAMRKPIGENQERWIDIPPRGDLIDVFLVFANGEGKQVERPISDFLRPSDDGTGGGTGGDAPERRFPTHSFIFAGSILHGEGASPKRYLADMSGNVISITTFGDELLCLPGIHSHANGMLAWQIDATDLPAVGSKIILRLRPHGVPKPG